MEFIQECLVHTSGLINVSGPHTSESRDFVLLYLSDSSLAFYRFLHVRVWLSKLSKHLKSTTTCMYKHTKLFKMLILLIRSHCKIWGGGGGGGSDLRNVPGGGGGVLIAKECAFMGRKGVAMLPVYLVQSGTSVRGHPSIMGTLTIGDTFFGLK